MIVTWKEVDIILTLWKTSDHGVKPVVYDGHRVRFIDTPIVKVLHHDMYDLEYYLEEAL